MLDERSRADLFEVCPALGGPHLQCVAAHVAHKLNRPDVLSHAALIDPIAEWSGLSVAQRHTLQSALHWLQLAIDVADDVGDWLDDPPEKHAAYASIPLAWLSALPAVVLGAVVQMLHAAFPDTASRAVPDLLQILATMVHGQAATGDEKLDKVAGAQALLLCLPLLLAPATAEHEAALKSLRDFCPRFGRVWELQQRVGDDPSDHNHNALRKGLASANMMWPSFGPFAYGGALSAFSLGYSSFG